MESKDKSDRHEIVPSGGKAVSKASQNLVRRGFQELTRLSYVKKKKIFTTTERLVCLSAWGKALLLCEAPTHAGRQFREEGPDPVSRLKLVDLENDAEPRICVVPAEPIEWVYGCRPSFSPCGRFLAIGAATAPPSLLLIDTERMKALESLEVIASEGTARKWELQMAEGITRLLWRGDIAWSESGDLLAAVSVGHSWFPLKLWQVSAKGDHPTMRLVSEASYLRWWDGQLSSGLPSLKRLAFSAKDEHLALVVGKLESVDTVFLLDLPTLREGARFEIDDDVQEICWACGGSSLLVLTVTNAYSIDPHALTISNLKFKGEMCRTSIEHSLAAVLTGETKCWIDLVDLASSEPVTRWIVPSSVCDMRWSVEGTKLFVGCWDGWVYIYKLPTGVTSLKGSHDSR